MTLLARKQVTEQHLPTAVFGGLEDYFLEFLRKNDNIKNYAKVSVLRSSVREAAVLYTYTLENPVL